MSYFYLNKFEKCFDEMICICMLYLGCIESVNKI